MDYSVLDNKSLIELCAKEKSPDKIALIEVELRRRSEHNQKLKEQEKLAKELHIEQKAREDQERIIKEREDNAKREAFLQTPEGQASLEVERKQRELERDLAQKQAEQDEQEQRKEQEHTRYIFEEFDEREARQILDRERTLGRWLLNDELNQYRKGSDKWAHVIDVIDSREHPDYQSMYKQYMRAQGKKLATPEDNLLISKFNDKFRNNTSNAIQNTNNNTTNTALIQPGTNENDVKLVTIQEASKIIKLNYSFMEKTTNQVLSAFDKMSSELEKSREHIRKLEKQQLKHSERIESIQGKAYKAELEMFRQKRKYAKKHPIASALEGGAKTVEKVMETIAYVSASPEDKAKIDTEKAQKKLAKKLAEDITLQDMIDKKAEEKARELVEKILAERLKT